MKDTIAWHGTSSRWALCLILTAVASGVRAQPDVSRSEAPTPEQIKFFESKIRPVLIRECYGCHSEQAGQAKGGLRLDSRAALLRGGDSGEAVVPGQPEASLLFGAITHTDFVMPPKRKLSDSEIADFRAWIADGAPDPRVTQPIATPESTIDERTIAEARQNFWAYQEPHAIDPPSVAKPDWARTDVDRFVLAGLRQQAMEPAGDADSGHVLRRLCFDLVGLPPEPQQVRWFDAAYAADPDAAIDRVVDQLLDSPHFGEHWARHWLDVARYAESTGREVNVTYPHAWRYRDYVIDAFNADKPYNEFVQEQLAGDLMPAPTDQEWTEHLIATGFLALGTKNVNEQRAAQFKADLIDEQIDATTRVFLGTSVACARCHDHKFDPIRQSDYYALAGIFGSTETFYGNPPSEYGNRGTLQQRQNSSLLLLPVRDPNPIGASYSRDELDDMHEQIRQAQQRLADVSRQRSRNAADASAQRQRIQLINQISQLSAKLAVVDDQGVPRSYCMGVQDASRVGDARLLVRGEIDQAADSVSRDLPLVFRGESLDVPAGSSGRLELARWIGSDENPLAARVMVNRLWHALFGQGLVPTTEDFGATGMRPSHPELLDTLAVRFVESGWSVKTLIRQLTRSRVYRMASTFDAENHRKDPENRLLWRSNVKRLPAEALRDAMLSIAGVIDTERPLGSKVAEAGYTRVRNDQLGDPRERIREAIEQSLVSRSGDVRRFRQRVRAGQAGPGGMSRGQVRMLLGDRRLAEVGERASQEASLDCVLENYRSIYLPVVRDFVPRSLEVFDFADPSMIVGTRETSNTPNQALYMMNNPLPIRLSDAFAERIIREAATTKERVELAFRLAYGREPSADERTASHRYLREAGMMPRSAYASFCQSLFAAAEFRYLN